MLVYVDIVQVSKMITNLQKRLDKIREENKQLKDENTSLKNRPISETPKTIIQITASKKRKFDLTIPVEEWNSGHFITYFREKYYKKYKKIYDLTDKDWMVFTTRIKQFRDKREELTNKWYKQMIDWIFNNKPFVPTPYSITSGTIYQNWRETTKGTFVSKQVKSNPPVVNENKLALEEMKKHISKGQKS
jgi:hypothetical protein